jgi:hypothetical protein
MHTPHDNTLLEWIDRAVEAIRGGAQETRVVDWLIHHVPGMHQLDTRLGRCALQQECKRVLLARLSASEQTLPPRQKTLENIVEGRSQLTVADVLALLRTDREREQ